jgi:hypothetical protein
MTSLLMPRATAAWLVENTKLSFDQIAKFCQVHVLEIQAIADGDVQTGPGLNPVYAGQLTKEEIERCEADPTAVLVQRDLNLPEPSKRAKGPRYTPVNKRQDKPDGVAYLVKQHPELLDAQIGRLMGTTKPTIKAIRERTHWNMANIKPRHPVGLGLCSQPDLDAAIAKAQRRLANIEKAASRAAKLVAQQTEQAANAVAAVNNPTPEIMAEAEAVNG